MTMCIPSRFAVAIFLTAMTASSAASGSDPKVGDSAPEIAAMNPDGNNVQTAHLKGQVVLLAFWAFDPESKSGMPLDSLRELRREFADDKRFLIITVCVNDSDDWEAWGEFLVGQGQVEYEGYRGRFIDDPKWWNTVQADVEEPTTAQRYGADGTPAYFLFDGAGRLAAVSIPPAGLKETVGRILNRK
jgi:hypothetical protein